MKKFAGPALVALGLAVVTVGVLMATSEPELEPGTIEITLQGPDGSPTGCRATLYEVTANDGRRMKQDSSSNCNEDGVLTWTGQEPGKYRLMAATDGAAMLDHRLELLEGPGLREGPLQFAPGGRIFGVVTANGVGVPEVEMRVSDGAFGHTDSSGKYRIDGVSVGELEIRAGKGVFGAVQSVEVVQGQTVQVDMQLEAMASVGQIGVRVEDSPEGVVVAETRPGWPAEAWLKAGDLVRTIDDEPALDRMQAKALLAGEPGQVVRLGIEREGEQLDLEITRRAADEETP